MNRSALLLAVILGAVVGFAAGRALAAQNRSQLTAVVFAPVAAPGPSVGRQGAQSAWEPPADRVSQVAGNTGRPAPTSPYPAADVEESVGGTLELPAAASSDEGWATWCAPTPTHCQGWGGDVLVGAVRSFSYGDRPYTVTVWRGSRHVSVRVISHCACGNRAGRPTLIDLSPAAFQRLAPLAAGVIEVRVVRGGALATERPLPATDVEGGG